MSVISVSGPLSPPSSEALFLCDCASGSLTITLPAPASCNAHQLQFKRRGSAGVAALVGPIDSGESYALEYEDEFVTLVSDGSKWVVTAE